MTELQRSIVLIGFMGSGKSSVGKLLAHELGWPLFDTDETIATALGITLSEIFARRGEEDFREMESELLQKFDNAKATVIVTGGGVVLRQANVARLRELGTVVWLVADVATLQERLGRGDDRPLLQTADPAATIGDLLAQREELYEGAADVVIDTSQFEAESVAQVIREVVASSFRPQDDD